MFRLDDYLAGQRARIEEALDRHLPAGDEPPARLHAAMRYSVLGGGKRLRPVLCLAAAEAVGGPSEPALVAGVAIEYLHAYTLVHDDLPAMDNDDLRRGRPTVHKEFGEANAILAGDALLTLAFELLAGLPAAPPYPPGQLALELATAVGSRGVAGGQFEDLAAEGGAPTRERVEYIHRNKTAKLIRAACRIGALAAGGRPEQVDALGLYGEPMGLAFQIADDLLNVTSTAGQLGKAVGSDAERRKMSYVALAGVEGAQRRARALAREAKAALAGFAPPPGALLALADYTVDRPN